MTSFFVERGGLTGSGTGTGSPLETGNCSAESTGYWKLGSQGVTSLPKLSQLLPMFWLISRIIFVDVGGKKFCKKKNIFNGQVKLGVLKVPERSCLTGEILRRVDANFGGEK